MKRVVLGALAGGIFGAAGNDSPWLCILTRVPR